MAKLFSEYHTNMRTALSDPGIAGVFAYSNEQLDGAIKSTVQMGLGPRGTAVNAEGNGLDPEPASPDARGYLVIQAALLIMGGKLPVGWKTRAMSVMISPFERQATLDHLRRTLQRIEKLGDPHGNGGVSCFGIWQDMENSLCRTEEPERLA